MDKPCQSDALLIYIRLDGGVNRAEVWTGLKFSAHRGTNLHNLRMRLCNKRAFAHNRRVGTALLKLIKARPREFYYICLFENQLFEKTE